MSDVLSSTVKPGCRNVNGCLTYHDRQGGVTPIDSIVTAATALVNPWTPVARESIAKVPNQELAKRAKCFLSSDGLAQYCVNLSRWFTHETAAFCMEQCTTPSLFHSFEVSRGIYS